MLMSEMTDTAWNHRLREVESDLRSHVDVCEERYTRIREDFIDLRRDMRDLRTDMDKGFDKVNSLLIKISLLIGAGMAAILAKLVFG